MTRHRLLIFVPEINPATFVLFYYRGTSGRSYSIRDYSGPIVNRLGQADFPYTADEIIRMAEREGSFSVEASAVSTDETAFWSAAIAELNEAHLPAERPAGESAKIAIETAVEGHASGHHVVRPTTPFGNRLALNTMVSQATGTIRWYERHLPNQALKVLYGNINRSIVQDIRLLSGRANVNDQTREDLGLLQAEFSLRGATQIAWRALSKTEAQRHHDRVFMSDAGSFNIPPLNTWLLGQTSEVTETLLNAADFDEWWQAGRPI